MLLRDWISQNGMTHDAFAELIGVTRPAVSYWCSGRSRPGARSARVIATITRNKVTAEDLQLAWEVAHERS